MTDLQLTHTIIGSAIAVRREPGPGLLEAIYEECLSHGLTIGNIAFEGQKPIPAVYKGAKLDCGYRADIVVLSRVIVEIKAISAVAPIHDAVILAYLRLSGCMIGLLINLHSAVLKDGIKRYVGKYVSVDEKKRTKHRDTEDTEIRCLKKRFEC